MNTTRQTMPVVDAVAACKEEIELEALVSIVGGTHAQRAAQEHRIPDLVAAYMGPYHSARDEMNGHA